MAGLVQSGAGVDGFGVTDLTATITGVTAGNLLIAVVNWNRNGVTLAPAADTGWSVANAPAGVASAFAGYNTGTAIYYKESVASGAHSFDANAPETFAAFRVRIYEFNYTGTGLLDKTASDGLPPNGGGAASTGNSAVTSQANELVIAAVALAGVFGDTTGLSTPAATGYASLDVETDSYTSSPGETSYKEVSATGAQSAAWTFTNTTVEWHAVLATFKGASSGSPGNATGAGVTDNASAPSGSASGNPTATGSGVTDNATAPSASALGYALITLANPIYTGQGSIAANSNFSGTAIAGDVVRYPTNNGFKILSDASIEVNSNTGSYVCYYNDGTGEVAFTVTITNTAYASGSGVTDTATAPNGSTVGGGAASGAGVTDSDSAPGGTAKGNAAASGAGVTDSDSAPTGSGTGQAQASGSGVTDTATAPSGSASGGGPGNASGSGVTDNATAPNGNATGNAAASGAGVTDSDSAPGGSGTGGGQATGAGVTDTATAPSGNASGGVTGNATGSGVTDTTTAPSGAASGSALATGNGVTDNATATNGAAAGSAQASGTGVTDTASAPSGSASSPSVAQGSGVTDNTTAANGSAAGASQANGNGVTDSAAAPTGSAYGGEPGLAVGAGVIDIATAPAGSAASLRTTVYATSSDMIKRFGEAELILLTDRSGTGEIDAAVINRALIDTDAKINGYLQGRYVLPLPRIPRVLLTYACDIARYQLYEDRAPDKVVKRYKAALRFLLMVAKGAIALGVDVAGEPAVIAGIQSSTPNRTFTSDTLKDFNS